MSSSNWVHLDVESIEKETKKAFLFLLEDGELVWVPKGQISEAEKYEVGDKNLSVGITEWLANQKGLSG